MPSLSIVENEPIYDSYFSLRNILVGFQIDFFILDAAPQSFDKDIIHPPPFPVHADGNVVKFQDTGKILGSKLYPLVSVENLRGAIEVDSFLKSLYTVRSCPWC